MSVMEHGDHPRWVTVSDERDGGALRHFWAVRLGGEPEGDELVWCAVYVTDGDNGFGWPIGVAMEPLKHLGNGFYGA